MTDNTPPPELVEQWLQKANREIGTLKYNLIETFNYGVTQAAQWGCEQGPALSAAWLESELQKARDEELEACCTVLDGLAYEEAIDSDRLRDARRPKPPSEADLALERLELAKKYVDVEPIYRALQRLKKLEEEIND